MAIVDWQLVSVLNSPVYDVAMLLYVCASVEDLENIEDLLKTYYTSFQRFMKELGSDPDRIFPHTIFQSHWKRYSIFGFMLVPIMMKFLYIKEEDIQSVDAIINKETNNWLTECIIQDEVYENRIIGLFKRFFSDSGN